MFAFDNEAKISQCWPKGWGALFSYSHSSYLSPTTSKQTKSETSLRLWLSLLPQFQSLMGVRGVAVQGALHRSLDKWNSRLETPFTTTTAPTQLGASPIGGA